MIVLTKEQLINLEGDKVYLKRLEPSMKAMYAKALMHTSYETRKYTTTAMVFTQSGIEDFVENISKDSSRIDFVILSKNDNEMVGDLSINDINPQSRTGSFRIAIDQKSNYQKGYGQEAMILALNHAFGMMNLHRIELEVLVDNKRAIHVYEKIGFVQEGLKRKCVYFDHAYHDMIFMGLLKEDFLKANPQIS
jgi:RimJ/RimL family protein N-acetyltransferase